MSVWRQQILKRLPLKQQNILLVYDKDDVLSDEQLLKPIFQQGFQVFEVKDQTEFRLHVEQRSPSSRWLYKIVGEGNQAFPFDLIEQYGAIELTLQIAFPAFPRPILQQLSHDVLDELDSLSDRLVSPFSDSEAYEFLLKYVYKLSYAMIETEEEWIAFLIKLHDHRLAVPESLKQYIKERVLQRASQLKEKISLINSKTDFMTYLQVEWEKLLERYAHDYKKTGGASFFKESIIMNPMVQGMIQHYFMEGKLVPVFMKHDVLIPSWAKFGVMKPTRKIAEDLQYLSEKIRETLNKEQLLYKDWILIAQYNGQMKWLELVHRANFDQDPNLRATLNQKFKDWMLEHYHSLASFSAYHQPVMVHQIMPYLRYREEEKQALIVIDGMGFVQWKQIKQALDADFVMEETGVFAWVPTITEISRQAIFQAQIPSLHQSISEEVAWKQFWQRDSFHPAHITFENILAQGPFRPSDLAAAKSTNVKRSAIILRNIDAFIHGAIQGLDGMFAEIEVWLQTNYLQDLLKHLVNEGFCVYITSDHGNIECVGIGRPSQGVLAETRGERVRIYTERVFRDEAAAKYPSLLWESKRISGYHYYLMAEDGQAFVQENKRVVSHGGMTLDEVIVPFVRLVKSK